MGKRDTWAEVRFASVTTFCSAHKNTKIIASRSFRWLKIYLNAFVARGREGRRKWEGKKGGSWTLLSVQKFLRHLFATFSHAENVTELRIPTNEVCSP